MGNCECNTCPGELQQVGQVQPTPRGFAADVQLLIDGIRNKHKNQISNIKQYQLPNKKVYRGVITGGKKQGYGQFYQQNNAYFGQFANDVAQGDGLLVKNYNNYIKGTFVNGKPNGQIKYKIENNQFQGHFVDGQKSKGLLKTQSYTYEGTFKNNKFNGYGILQFKNGDKFQGDFVNGLYHGDGKYQTPGQGSYHGQFRNGQYEGKGLFKWRNDFYYQGEYKAGVRNGFGKFVKGKDQSQGFWVDGQPQSNSKFLLPKEYNNQIQNKVEVI